MKYKNILNVGLTLVIGLLFFACSQSDDSTTAPLPVKVQNGIYVYKVDFKCESPGYDIGTTRAVTYDWKKGSTLFARYKSGSTYYKGLMFLDSDGWYMVSTSEFIDSNHSGTCELYYFLESNGDYYSLNTETGYFDIYNNGSFVKSTDIAWNAETISLSEGTAVFCTTTATYTNVANEGYTLEATLTPMMWRMRFSGSSGTTITMPSNGNHIKYCSAFNLSSTSVSFTKSAKDVSLTVSGGYTPYIYGEFLYSYATNKITVVNGSNTFYREFSSSSLPAGKSGYFTIPTTSNYSSYGWTMKSDIDSNATIQPDYLVTFTDGVALDFKIGSTVNTFDYTVFTKTGAEALSDDELVAETYTSPMSKDHAEYIQLVASTEFFKPNTEYYLCAVAKNSSGKRGPVCRYLFKTNATGLPSAPISNVTASSSTKWAYKIALKNGATSYYLGVSLDENRYKSDWHFWAYIVHYWATTGQLEAHDWSSVATTLDSGTCNVITIGTWGIGANGSIGNPEVAFGSTSSSAPAWKPVTGTSVLKKDEIPKSDLQKMLKNTKLYRVDF